MTIQMISHISLTALAAPSHLSFAERLPVFVLAAAAVFAYQIAFCTAGSDYSRYLHPETSANKIAALTFYGSALAGIWLEILGAAITSLNPQAEPIAQIVSLMGFLAIPSLLAIVISTIPVNVLAIYSGGMSLLAAGIPLKRWQSAFITGVLGIVIIASGSGAFADIYKNFLLLLSYWIAPWLGILLAVRPFSTKARAILPTQALIIYLVSLVCSVPFMASSLYTGYISRVFLGGADVSYLIGLLVSVIGINFHMAFRCSR